MYTKGRIIDFKKTLIFIFIFLLPLNLSAKKFFVKMSFGVVTGGGVDDSLLTQAKYSDYISIGAEGKPKPGEDIYLEFIYQPNPYISFSLGNGYISKTLKGKTAQFSPPAIESLIQGGFTLSPEFSLGIVPVCFSAILSLPVKSSFQINFTGGVGYYFGTFESKTEWTTPSALGYNPAGTRSWNFKGKGNTVGYHVGAGFDIDLSWNLFLAVEALYRTVNFDNVKSSGDIGGDTTFFYFRFFGAEDISADFDYIVSRVSLSGYSIRAGLKFKF